MVEMITYQCTYCPRHADRQQGLASHIASAHPKVFATWQKLPRDKKYVPYTKVVTTLVNGKPVKSVMDDVREAVPAVTEGMGKVATIMQNVVAQASEQATRTTDEVVLSLLTQAQTTIQKRISTISAEILRVDELVKERDALSDRLTRITEALKTFQIGEAHEETQHQKTA